MGPGQQTDRWETVYQRMRSLVRVPVIVAVVVVVGLAAWLCSVTAWRAAVWLFDNYLDAPW